MIKKWIENLTFTASNDDQDMRRKHMRRESDTTVAQVNGKTYPVDNWSEGGILICADDKEFSIQDPIHMKLKFKLSDRMIEIEQFGTVLRKNFGRIAVQFSELSDVSSVQFKNVISDAVTQEFAATQMA